MLPDDFSQTTQFRTQVSVFGSGAEQRRSRWANPRTTYSFSFPSAIDAQIDTIYSYYVARKGSYESFWLAVPPGVTFLETVVDANSVILADATKPSPLNLTVKIDGVQLFGCTFTEATKTVNFPSAQTGVVDILFHELVLVRFAQDNLDRDYILWLITSQSLNFITI